MLGFPAAYTKIRWSAHWKEANCGSIKLCHTWDSVSQLQQEAAPSREKLKVMLTWCKLYSNRRYGAAKLSANLKPPKVTRIELNRHHLKHPLTRDTQKEKKDRNTCMLIIWAHTPHVHISVLQHTNTDKHTHKEHRLNNKCKLMTWCIWSLPIFSWL